MADRAPGQPTISKPAHDAAVKAWLKAIPQIAGQLDSALDAAILAALPHLTPTPLPTWWRPSPALHNAIVECLKIKSDLDSFDGDRRGISATLVAAEIRVISALDLDDEDCQDYDLISAAAQLIISMVGDRAPYNTLESI